jgi:Mg-chelatase subunit ChlD
MTDWASATRGHVSRFASQADGEAAYRRVAAWLKRPTGYAFRVSAETSPPPPAVLRVELANEDVATGGAGDGPGLAVAIILDASGSMLQRIGGERRIDVAKRILRNLGNDVLPDGLPVSLRVFGHDAPGSCASELFLPLAPLDRRTFAVAVDRVQSINLARTSIAASLRAVAGDLAAADGVVRIVVLVTDGEETCDGDPLAEIETLRAADVDVKLNIVGMGIDDTGLRQTFEAWAEAGGGTYLDASDPAALAAALEAATRPNFAVIDAAGEEVARGRLGEAIELPAGRYFVRLGGSFPDHAVTLSPGESAIVVLERP